MALQLMVSLHRGGIRPAAAPNLPAVAGLNASSLQRQWQRALIAAKMALDEADLVGVRAHAYMYMPC